MLTFSCAKLTSASWGVRIGAVVTLSVMAWSSARADGIAVGSCVGGQASASCVVRWGEAGDPNVRQVPQPFGEFERARATERDHKWLERCRPEIVQDRYGVARYRYAAPGCEFGVLE